MKKLILTLVCLFIAGFFTTTAAQKKAADYKLIKIKVVPFEQKTGEFESEIRDENDNIFHNEISKRYLITVEIAGEAGSFEVGRKLEITVTEGKKAKGRKLEQIGLIGDDGKFYLPLWIDEPFCDDVKITARITGQKKIASITRILTMFQCGE